mmetsp:Transcript_120113/g.339908  ORF Transcript_120113/g.339908 Transcript_120113/m.339908 type:complete len:225 (-) Transcript_120113:888-1562(-)
MHGRPMRQPFNMFASSASMGVLIIFTSRAMRAILNIRNNKTSFAPEGGSATPAEFADNIDAAIAISRSVRKVTKRSNQFQSHSRPHKYSVHPSSETFITASKTKTKAKQASGMINQSAWWSVLYPRTKMLSTTTKATTMFKLRRCIEFGSGCVSSLASDKTTTPPGHATLAINSSTSSWRSPSCNFWMVSIIFGEALSSKSSFKRTFTNVSKEIQSCCPGSSSP